jgi:hypothetical protein
MRKAIAALIPAAIESVFLNHLSIFRRRGFGDLIFYRRSKGIFYP